MTYSLHLPEFIQPNEAPSTEELSAILGSADDSCKAVGVWWLRRFAQRGTFAQSVNSNTKITEVDIRSMPEEAKKRQAKVVAETIVEEGQRSIPVAPDYCDMNRRLRYVQYGREYARRMHRISY